TSYYKTDDLLTQMGIGEALITLLNEKGIPTPLMHTMLCSPRSRMDVLSDIEIDALVSKSRLVNKYNRMVDSESAYEILTEKLEEAAQKTQQQQQEQQVARQQKKITKETSFFDNSAVKRAE